METLRRALCTRERSIAAKTTSFELVARAQTSESSSNPDAFALFDAAYLAEAYQQWLGEKIRTCKRASTEFTWDEEAILLRGNDPQMDFAAALITLRGLQPNTRKRAKGEQRRKQRPAARAQSGSPFSGFTKFQTMAEMILENVPAKVRTAMNPLSSVAFCHRGRMPLAHASAGVRVFIWLALCIP